MKGLDTERVRRIHGLSCVCARNRHRPANPHGAVAWPRLLGLHVGEVVGPLFALLSGSTNDFYSFFPVVNDSPYGSEIGGCIPAGDSRYVNNLWENRWAGSQFPFPLYQPSLPRYPNLSDWPNNPLFYNPTPLLSYYSLTKGLTFAGNKFLVYDAHGPNPAISAWLARRGAGTRWKPGAG